MELLVNAAVMGAGIMCMAFHPDYPNLLAVGCYDGSVLIFDVRSETGKPLYQSTAKSGKHTEPVWQVQGKRSSQMGGLQRPVLAVACTLLRKGIAQLWRPLCGKSKLQVYALAWARTCHLLPACRCHGSAQTATSCSSTASPPTAG
jgi:WD40 repeat protein